MVGTRYNYTPPPTSATQPAWPTKTIKPKKLRQTLYKQTCIVTDTYAYLHNLWFKSDATISTVLLGIAPRGTTKNANRRHPKKKKNCKTIKM